jgi:serpin B
MQRWFNFIPRLLLILIFLAFNACSLFEDGKQNQVPPRDLTPVEKELVTSANRFGFNLFHSLSQSDSTGNIFISPLSVSMALGMVLNGAVDSTYTAIQNTLGFEGLTETEINESYQSLIKLLTNLDTHIDISIANSIWYRTGLPVFPDFIKTNQKYFSAQVRELDFQDPRAPGIINNWVSQKTKGLIPTILDVIPDEMIMYLIDAVYFKGQWRVPFEKKNTQDNLFYNLDGSESTLPFMSQEMPLACLFDTNMTVLDIPYSDSLYSMTILIPEGDPSLETVIGDIYQGFWDQWIGQLSPHVIQLQLPKFEIDYGKKLNDILSSLGMAIAFDPVQADLSRIADVSENIFISEVQHKTYLKVDEEGTTAAAVTLVGAGTTSVPPRIIVNHPFIVAIRENHSGTILFIGRITTL